MPGTEARAEAVRWLGYACGDLGGARADLTRDDVPARLAAFRAQQAAEKAIKALLVLVGADFGRIHDLEALVLKLPDDSVTRSLDVDLERLTDYAVAGRYPDALEEIGRQEAARAVEQATSIYESVLADAGRLAGIGPDEVISQ